MEEKYRIETVAYHEAGHAVMALFHGWGVMEAEIQTPFSGSTLIRYKPSTKQQSLPSNTFQQVELLKNALREIEILLAGPIAEAEFCNKPYEKLICSGPDFQEFLEIILDPLIKELLQRYMNPDLNIIIANTINAVIEPTMWRHIELLAENMMRKHHLSGDEIITLLSAPGASSRQLQLLRK